MMKIKNFKSNSGIILIESILALTIIVVILTALVTALVFSVNTSTFSKDETVAAGYAQEGLEIVRNDKEVNFAELRSMESGTYCLFSGDSLRVYGSPISDGCNKIDDAFTRTIYINQQGIDSRNGRPPGLNKKCDTTTEESIFVVSSVSWTDSRCENGEDCHVVELNSCFADLNTN